MVASTRNLIASPAAKTIKRRFRHLWKRYLCLARCPSGGHKDMRWFDLAGHEFKFRVATPALWWLKKLHEGKWQKGVTEFLKDTFQPGDVYFDIGPWIGIYTLLRVKPVAAGGRIDAFEPDTLTRRLLEQNLAANHLSNVTVLPYAVTDQEGSARFDAGKGKSCRGRVHCVMRTITAPPT